MTGPLAWDEVAAWLARVLGEPVNGGLPLTPGLEFADDLGRSWRADRVGDGEGPAR